MRRVLLVSAVVLAAGCGGSARQDAGEPSGTFKVDVVGASFPRAQRVAQTVELRLRVRNADSRTLPVAVTVETEPASPGVAAMAFEQLSPDPALADGSRPVWVLERGPADARTAVVNTWLTPPLRPGESRLLTWRLVASKAGRYTVGYRIAPGLTGKAKAAAGGRIGGRFRVAIDGSPVPARIGANGEVVNDDGG